MAISVSMPDQPYIPGRTPRPAEGSFDAVRETVHAGMSETELGQSLSFRAGLEFLDKGYFWEAHEVLEPVWMALPQDSDPRKYVQGVIQLANGFLKIQMDRPGAAARLSVQARDLLRHDCGALMSDGQRAWIRGLSDSLAAEAKSAK